MTEITRAELLGSGQEKSTTITTDAQPLSFPPFVEFASIPRLFREVVITEKIDGTNASIHITEDGQVRAASRTRYIVPLADNFGFAAWVERHADELREGLGAGQHFGEWYGSGIQRGYGLLNGEKRFALFNTHRWGPLVGGLPNGVDVVPVLGIRTFDTAWIREVAMKLIAEGSQIAPGFMKPEGVVLFHPKSNSLYKYTFDKNDGHKGTP